MNQKDHIFFTRLILYMPYYIWNYISIYSNINVFCASPHTPSANIVHVFSPPRLHLPALTPLSAPRYYSTWQYSYSPSGCYCYCSYCPWGCVSRKPGIMITVTSWIVNSGIYKYFFFYRYLMAIISLKHCQRPSVVTNFKFSEYQEAKVWLVKEKVWLNFIEACLVHVHVYCGSENVPRIHTLNLVVI